MSVRSSVRSTVHLIRHGATPATRSHAFPVDESLDTGGRRSASALKGVLSVDRVVTSKTKRCQETAQLAGLQIGLQAGTDILSDARWDELNFGRWAGQSLDTVGASDPSGVSAWLENPVTVAPPGGETTEELSVRVASALAELSEPGMRTAVVTSGGPIKVACLQVLGAPLDSLWRLDIAPCSVTTLHGHRSGDTMSWNVASVNVLYPLVTHPLATPPLAPQVKGE